MGIDYHIALFLYKFGETYSIFVYFVAETLPYIVSFAAALLALRMYRTLPHLSLALLTSVIVSRFFVLPLIRIFIERPRPFISHDDFNPLFEPIGFSFPSGHATAFFAIAAVIYSWNKKIGSVFFLAALMIGLARIFAGVHYPLDILGGAILGMIVGFITAKYILKK